MLLNIIIIPSICYKAVFIDYFEEKLNFITKIFTVVIHLLKYYL